uniref:Polyprotein allergen nematode domain-containing protein n=1 Tax=Panagrellus redivivus TaxID=6233 RepID=A0A7E4WCR0_PANRE
MYVILTKSKTLDSFKVFLFLQTLWAQLFEIVVILTNPIPCAPYTAVLMGGIFREVMTYEAAVGCACLFLCLYINVITSIFNSLVNRFIFTFRPHWRKYVENKFTISGIVLSHFAAYAGVSFIFITTSTSYSDTRQLAFKETGNVFTELFQYPGFVYVPSSNKQTEVIILVYFFIVLAFAVALLITIVIFFKNIRAFKTTDIVSKTVKSMVISTLVQAFLCVLFVFTPVLFMLYALAFKVPHSANTLNILFTMLSFHGMTLGKLALLALVACAVGFSSERVRRSPAAKHILDTTWLTPAQKTELEGVKDASAINSKFLGFYNALSKEKQQTISDKIIKKCYDWLEEVATETEITDLKKLHHANHGACKSKVREFLGRLPSAEQTAISNHLEACESVWYGQHAGHDHSGHGHHHRMRRDHHHGHGHTLDDYLKTHLSWLTEAQGQQLKDLKTEGKTPADIQAKVLEFYDAATGEVKEKATELLQGGCREVLKHVVGEEKANELKTLKESGASNADIAVKVEELIGGVSDEHKKKLATTYGGACKKVFGVTSARLRRDHAHGENDLEHFAKEHLTWLTADQKAEVLKLKGDKAAVKAKVHGFLEAATGETKAKAIEDLKGACRHLLAHVLGDKFSEITKLKESGASTDAIKAKIDELVGQVTDEHLKAEIADHKDDCEKIYKGASRKRRDHDHKLAEFAEKYLTWLSADEKAEVLALEGTGKDAVKAKIAALYEAADPETKEKATSAFQSACRNHLVHVIGEEKATELKTLKESGASKEDLVKKADELISAISDPELKKEADEHREDCLKIFGVEPASRMRRDHGHPQDHARGHGGQGGHGHGNNGHGNHHGRKRRDHHHGHGHTLDDYLKTHLSWLTEAQGQQLKDLKTEGKTPADIQAKVLEFYDAATGEVKDKATELLQGGCREVLKHVVGDEKANELKTLKESGASNADIAAKVEELIGGVSDEHKKKLATTYGGACKKVFGVTSARLRREESHDDHDIEHFAKEHLTWLTAEQKTEVLKLKGDKAAIKAKVQEYLHAADGPTKAKAVEDLQGACKHVLRHILGEKAAEVKTLKESGASNEVLKAKVDELIAGVTDPHLKEDAAEYKEDCYKLFASAQSRKRRHEGKSDLEDFVSNHLNWLTPEQKDAITALKDAKDEKGVKAKVAEYYAAATGTTKDTATQELQDACRELISDVLGDKVNEIKTLKESGASKEDIAAKVDELLAGVTDAGKKAKGLEYAQGCKRVFGVGARKRRHEGKTDLEDFVDNHLNWLTPEQKTAIAALKDAKDEKGVKAKVAEYYAATTGETKETATAELQGACRELIADVLGDKAAEIKTLKESGASKEDIAAKVDELLAGVTDAGKKAKGLEYAQGCKKLFGVGSRKRRAFSPTVTHLDFFKQIVDEEDLLEGEELAYAIMDIYDAEDLSENARETVVECHSLYAEVVKIDKVLGDNSARELVYALKSASNRQLRGIQAITNICKKTVDEHRESNGERGCLDDTIVSKLDELDDSESVKRVWKEKCIDWITDVTSQEEQANLKMLLRTKQRDVVTERINYFMARFDTPTRKQIGHMRPVCERLLFY